MDAAKMMGYETPTDKKVPVTVRDWSAMKLALWRSRELAEIAAREALQVLGRCEHSAGCPGAESETEPCFSPSYAKDEESASEVLTKGCPDREQRMSALVILNAARQLAPADARKPADEHYFAPSREYFSEVLAALAVLEIDNQVLRETLREAGISVPTPTSENNNEPAQLAPGEKTT